MKLEGDHWEPNWDFAVKPGKLFHVIKYLNNINKNQHNKQTAGAHVEYIYYSLYFYLNTFGFVKFCFY